MDGEISSSLLRSQLKRHQRKPGQWDGKRNRTTAQRLEYDVEQQRRLAGWGGQLGPGNGQWAMVAMGYGIDGWANGRWWSRSPLRSRHIYLPLVPSVRHRHPSSIHLTVQAHGAMTDPTDRPWTSTLPSCLLTEAGCPKLRCNVRGSLPQVDG